MEPSLRRRLLIGVIVAASDMAPMPGFERIYPADRHSETRYLPSGLGYSVHIKPSAYLPPWVAVFYRQGVSVVPSIFKLRQILADLSAPATN